MTGRGSMEQVATRREQMVALGMTVRERTSELVTGRE